MTAADSGPVALLGSGEYLPAMQAIERGLLAGRRPRMAQLATAAAPEGHERLRYWHRLGRDAADRLGVEQVVVPVVDRASAQDTRIAALIDDVGLVYLSGGNPRFLAATLRGTRAWDAIEQAWRSGAALAGCSAGAMALTAHAPDPRRPHEPPEPGLGVVPHLRIIPHFDRFGRSLPPDTMRMLTARADGITVLGIDEDTALVGGPVEWEVQGHGSVWALTASGRRQHPAGTRMRVAPAAVSRRSGSASTTGGPIR